MFYCLLLPQTYFYINMYLLFFLLFLYTYLFIILAFWIQVCLSMYLSLTPPHLPSSPSTITNIRNYTLAKYLLNLLKFYSNSMLYQITFNQLMFSNDRGRERERGRVERERRKLRKTVKGDCRCMSWKIIIYS